MFFSAFSIDAGPTRHTTNYEPLLLYIHVEGPSLDALLGSLLISKKKKNPLENYTSY